MFSLIRNGRSSPLLPQLEVFLRALELNYDEYRGTIVFLEKIFLEITGSIVNPSLHPTIRQVRLILAQLFFSSYHPFVAPFPQREKLMKDKKKHTLDISKN